MSISQILPEEKNLLNKAARYTKENGLSTVNQPTSSQDTLSTLLLGITHSSFFPPVKENLVCSPFFCLFSSFSTSPPLPCLSPAVPHVHPQIRGTDIVTLPVHHRKQEALILHSSHSKETFGFSSTGIHITWDVGDCFGYGNAFAHHRSADNEQSSGLMIFIRK